MPARSSKGMVVSTERHASMEGVETLKAGGNAIDAAVATAFTMAVTYPSRSTIGSTVKIDKLPFSFGYGAHKVTIYRYGPDWLELSIGERG